MKRIGKDNDNRQQIKTYMVAGGVALIIAVIGYLILIAVQNAVLTRYDRTMVAVLLGDTPEGCPLDKAEYEWREIDSRVVPSDALSEADFDGRYIKTSLASGSVLTRSVTEYPSQNKEGGIEIGLTLKNLQAGANGMVRTGDYIDLYLVPPSGAVTGTYAEEGTNFENLEILPVNRHVFVTSARSDDGLELYKDDSVSATRLNMIVSPEDAEYVTYMMAVKNYSVWVTICR